MALKSTKAMAAKSTARPSPNTEPPATTAEASAESKSSFEAGIEAEALVAQKYMEQGFKLIRQRWITPFAEVDLLFSFPQKPRHLLLIEVKKRTSPQFRWAAVSPRQKQRLKRVLLWLAESGYEVESRLVFVSKNEITEHELEF